MDKGEKLYEELTLGKKLIKTEHNKIYLCQENNYKNLNKKIKFLDLLIKSKSISKKKLSRIIN